METNRICPNCRKPLATGAPLGLCPECLIKSGFPTGTDLGAAQVAGARFVPPPVAEVAQLFPQLEILGLIGQGGMGAVYKARQPGLGRFVALKVLPPAVSSDPGFAERFNREARALAQLSHPNIVAVHDFGRVAAGILPAVEPGVPPGGPAEAISGRRERPEGVPGGRMPPSTSGGTPDATKSVNFLHYLVMELVDGTNLREVERAGRLSPEQALAIVPQICDALQFAHNEGIVHRDIKPENILLDKKGRVKITDFGIAKIVGADGGQANLTGAKDVIGTPHYMAPEQVERPQTVDHRADIYSLGVVFYEMLTGELPLGKFQPPSAKVQVDVRLDEVVLHSLEKEPERRYQHVSQVKTEVQTIAAGGPESKVPPSLHSGAASQSPTSRVLAPDDGVRLQVKGPALGLIVTGSLNWVLFTLAFILIGLKGMAMLARGPGPYEIGGLILLVPLAAMAVNSFIIYAGLKLMRLERRGAGVAAGILAMIVAPGNIVGLPMGIWTLVVLSRREVRAAFGASSSTAAVEPEQNRPAGTRLASNALFLSGLSGVLGIAAFCFMPEPPGILVWSILAAALAGIALAIPARRAPSGRQALVVGGINLAIWLVAAFAVNSPYFKIHRRELQHLTQWPGHVIAQTIRHEVGRQLREASATYDDLQVEVAVKRDSATPFKVTYRGLKNFKGPDGSTPPVNGEFIMEYMGGGRWQGELAGATFAVQVGSQDKIDLPFVDDPPVIGEWESVAFVADPADFNPDKLMRPEELYLKKLSFLPNGRSPYSWWTWTKGVAIHHGDRTASRYEIREINGQLYMFYEWKSGDVTISGMKPCYYVLRKKTSQ
jgi:serine/threonine protein kinase